MSEHVRKTRFDFSQLKNPDRQAPSNNEAPRRITKTRKEPSTVSSQQQLLPLDLPNTNRVPIRTINRDQRGTISPWSSYEKLYELQLGDDKSERCTIAMRMKAPNDIVSVREFPGASADGKIKKIQTLKHANIVEARDIFQSQYLAYVVFEPVTISLYHCAGNSRINEPRLAAIFGQVSVNALDGKLQTDQ